MYRNSEYVMSKIIDPKGFAKPAQIGVDLTVDSVLQTRGCTVVPREGKALLGGYGEVKWSEEDETMYLLEGNAYIIQFDQGIKTLSNEETAFILQRSSLNRSGVQLVGSVYDPGFGTDCLGATLYVYNPIVIQRHARLAQILIVENEPVKELYAGRFQGEKK